jgi:hypothetical protein
MGALVVPMDKAAEASVVKFETFMNEALEAYPTMQVKKSEELFGLPVDEEIQATFQRAEKGFEDARGSFEARKYEEAERKLRTTLKEYGRSVVLLRGCGHYCDALAMYAATLHARGDVEEAKLVTLDLLALHPSYDLNPKKFTKEFIQFRASVATSVPASLRGMAIVRTRPGGARVYVDGELRGYSPMTIGPLSMGKHLLRLERPGYRQRGEIVEITPEEQEVTAELVPTPLYKKYNAGMEAMALEVVRPQMGPAIGSAARTLSLDRVIVGALKELNNDGGTEVVFGLFDARSGRRLSDKKITFQGDEYGQLRSEVGRAITALVNAADGNKDRPTATRDPLQGKHGTEEWTGEDRGGKNTQSDRVHPPKDPLQGMSGTEDW